MTHRDPPTLERREREFVAWLGRHYGAPAETPARRAAFGDALRARLAGPRPGRRLAPALAAAALAGLVWLALPDASRRGAGEPRAWEYELLLSSDLSPAADREESRFLPDEYQAIAVVFLDS